MIDMPVRTVTREKSEEKTPKIKSRESDTRHEIENENLELKKKDAENSDDESETLAQNNRTKTDENNNLSNRDG